MTENIPASNKPAAKTPPLLLLGVLLFWGWQSDLLIIGAIAGAILEGSRIWKTKWDLAENDFRRIFTFSTLLVFAMAIYAFSSNEEGTLSQMFSGGATAFHNATVTGIRTATAFFRWLPIALFLIPLAQVYSSSDQISLAAISMFARRRAQKNKAAAGALNVTYPYFFVCLFSAAVHPNDQRVSFFWGACALFAWALWPFRSRRLGIAAWFVAIAVVTGAGYLSQRGIASLEHVLDNYNAQWFARFLRQRTDPMESATAIGHIGELKLSGRIVIRLHTENNASPPLYLREASYRIYHSSRRSWFSGTGRNDFGNISAETNQTSWVLVDKTNTQTLNIACYLNGRAQSGNPLGLLPLPTGSGRLDNLYAYIVQKNSEGAVLTEGPGLVIFDARYSAGQTIDAPPDIDGTNRFDLEVPTNEVPALEQIALGLKAANFDENQKRRAVAAFFANNFSYSVWQKADKSGDTNQTALGRFLLKTRSGHCEYFATATVLLLRELGVPARYGVGYFVHEKAGSGYVVRERDAHAWCLVWNSHTRAWEDFDTTPASWVAEEGRRASFMQWFSDLRSWVGFQIAKLRWGQSDLRKYILWGLGPVLILLLAQIVFRRRRKQKLSDRNKQSPARMFWPGLDSEFYRLEQKIIARGFPRLPGETLAAWLQRVGNEPELSAFKPQLQQLLRLHYRYRFDPKGLTDAERDALRESLKLIP